MCSSDLLIQIVKAFKLPIVKIEFLGWHIVNIFCSPKDGVYFSANIDEKPISYQKNQLGFEYLFNRLDSHKSKRVSYNSRGLGSNGTANRLSEKFHSAFLSFTARLMVLRLQPTVF